MRALLLHQDLVGVEFHQHGAVSLELLNRDGESEIVQKEELQLEMVELEKGEAADLFWGEDMLELRSEDRDWAADLGVAGVGVEDIGKEFARACYAGDDKTVNIETVDNEEMWEIVGICLCSDK